MKFQLFRRTRELEQKIDSFLDKFSEASVLFRLAVRVYLKQGLCDEFIARLEKVNQLESEADYLRLEIEKQLYSNTLIPGTRGDVLDLIERIDEVFSQLEGPLWAFKIERPDIPKEFRVGFRKLTNMAVKAVDELGLGSRAFFSRPHDVSSYNHKVKLYEKEADIINTELKQAIFSSELDLAHKLHLRDFAEHIDSVADMAEDVADRLAIYAIKRIV